MRSWNSRKQKSVRIEIIPMIDVMMFLLVFFVLLSLNVIPGFGFKTQQPASSFASPIQEPASKVVISISADALALDGQSLALAELIRALEQKTRGDKQARIVLNADKGVDVQRMVEVMDEVKRHGWHVIYLSARKKS